MDAEKRQTWLARLLKCLAEIQGQLNQRKYKRQAYTLEQIHLAQRGNAAQDLLDIRLEGADGELVLTFQVNAEKLALAEQRDGRYPILTNCWEPLSSCGRPTSFQRTRPDRETLLGA